ncbi:energy transducer TonB [Paraburkholderia sp.]|uniref:energy transducer TonB n=1 Tax=Paraburkholderia sp. TaxID=1926495 RepID=UPI00286F3B6E|nr:energy transducer TonB [Paraburkholderia sp.]
MNKKRLLLSAFPCMLALAACASDDPDVAGPQVHPSPEAVMNRCLASVAETGAPVPTEATLDARQWERYVNCKLGGNMFANPKKVPVETEAVVSIRATPDGRILSVKLLHSSGHADYDAVVERAIDVASPLPPVPSALRIARIDLHFHPVRVNPLALQTGSPAIGGMNVGVGISDQSHWRAEHCNIVNGVSACD